MNILANSELKNIYAGGVKIGIVAAIVGVVTFVVGVVDGYLRPLKCRK